MKLETAIRRIQKFLEEKRVSGIIIGKDGALYSRIKLLCIDGLEEKEKLLMYILNIFDNAERTGESEIEFSKLIGKKMLRGKEYAFYKVLVWEEEDDKILMYNKLVAEKEKSVRKKHGV